MSDERRTEGEPHDRLTRIAGRVGDHVENDPEFQEGDRCIVLTNNAKNSGIGLFGYDSDMEAFTELFLSLRAIMRVNGRELLIAPLRSG